MCGRHMDGDRLKGRGIVVAVRTKGLDMAHEPAPPTVYESKIYLAPLEEQVEIVWTRNGRGKLVAQ